MGLRSGLAGAEASRSDGAGERSLFSLAEPAEAQAELNRIDARIQGRKPRVRNVHEADFRADVVLAAQKVQAQSTAGREIDAGRSFRDSCVGEERAAANFEIGNHAAVSVQGPFESEGVHTSAVGSIGFLKKQKDRNDIYGILQTAVENSGAVGRGENQTVTQADIPNAIAGLTSASAVASAGPNLELVAALNGARLRASGRYRQEQAEEEGGDRFFQRGVSFRIFDSRHPASGAQKI